jgi:hypothetical protein
MEYGPTWCKTVNEQMILVTSNTKHSKLMKIRHGIYRFNAAKSKMPNKLAVISYTGDFYLTIAQIIILILHDKINPLDLELIVNFFNFLFTTRELKHIDKTALSNLIFKTKSMWVECFPPKNLQEEESEDSENNFSCEFVNFDTWDIWPEVLDYLGPSILFSGEIWEIMCRSMRQLKHGNYKEVEYSVLTKHMMQKQLELQSSSSLFLANSFVNIRNWEMVSPSERLLTITEIKDLKSCYSICYSKSFTLQSTMKFSSSTYLYGKKITVGDSFIVENPQNKKVFYGKFKFVMLHMGYTWIVMNFFRQFSIPFLHIIACEEGSQTQDYVPFNGNYNFFPAFTCKRMEDTTIWFNLWTNLSKDQ